MKKLFYILLLLISVKTYGQQPAPFNPVQLNQNTMYYEPITGDRYGYNGAVYKWYRIPFVIAPNTVISGLTLSVFGNTLTVQPGYWRISNIIYHKATTTIFTLAARDSVYSRYETVYADSANNIGIAVGTLSPNPVEPSIPSGDLRVGAALITPTGTSTIQPGPITNYVFTNPLVKQFAFPWVYSLRADTIKTAHYIFPANDGTSGQVIQTDGAGNLFWSNQAIYNAGFGLNLTANVFSADTIRMVTQTALKDTLTAHTANIGFGLLTSNDSLKVDTLVLPFIPLNFRSNIKVRQHGDTLSFNGPVIGTPLEGVYQSNPGARESSDFAVFGSGVNTSTNPKLLISDHSTVAYRAFMRGSTSATPLSGTDYSGFIIGDQDVTAAPGGSYSMFNQLAIKPVHIINTGGATIDSVYTLNILGPSTGGGVNGALKVKGGVTLLDLPAITGGTSLVVDAGGNVGTGSGGSSVFASQGLHKDGDTVKMGDSNLTGAIDIHDAANAVDFQIDKNAGLLFLGTQKDDGNIENFAGDGTGLVYGLTDLYAGTGTHNEYANIYVGTNADTISVAGLFIKENGLEVRNPITGKGLYANASIDTALMSLDPKSYITNEWATGHFGSGGSLGVTTFNTRSGAVTLTSGDVTTALGFTPENVANKSTTTTLGTSNTLYPTQNAVKTYVDNAVSGVTVPTGANPTATAGATAVNGSATTFMRSDAAPKVDSTVFQTVLNFFPKGDTRYLKTSTASSTYALQSTTISPGTGLSGGGSLAANRTLTVDTTVIRTTANSLTLAQLQTKFNLYGLLANPLSQFASTTSAQLLGVLSDETGSGVAVFGTSPTLATPVINGLPTGTGVASGATASTLVSRDANANVNNNNIILNGQSIATAAGTTTLTVASPNKTIFTGTTTQTVTLPVVNTLSLYHVFQIKNGSTGIVTVNSSGGNLVQSIAAGATSTFTCILTSGTSAASWWVDYGIGSTGILPIANGGTGSATQNFVDLTTGQTIAGLKTFQITGGGSTARTNTILLNNATAAVNGTQQRSGAIELDGNTFNNSISTITGFRISMDGAQSASPVGTLHFDRNLNGTYVNDVAALTTNGDWTVSGLVSGGSGLKYTGGTFQALTYNIYSQANTGVNSATAAYLWGGASTVSYRTVFGGNQGFTNVANDNFSNVLFANELAMSTASTGTSANASNVTIVGPTITPTGSGTVTDGSALHIDGPSTGAVNNHAIFVRSGNVNLQGLTASKVVFTDASKNLTSTGIGTSSQYILGDGTLGTIGARAHTIFTPTTGGTVSLTNNQYNIINPAGALLALTVNLPSSPANNDCVFIKFTQNVTTVTYGNGTVVDGITPTAGGLTVLVYDSGTTSWY